MRVFGMMTWSGVGIAIFLTALPSCRKPAEAVKSDLGEAGYQLAAADWFRASRGNDVAALKKFIAGGFATDTRDDAGDSALHAAAAAGARDAADFLMDRGITVDVRGASDRTPLMAAVLADQTGMVSWLLRQGANPRAKDKEGFIPLMLAVREGKSGAVEELAPATRESLDSAILLAALIGRAQAIDTLTNYGASVYARMDDGRTPLMIAAENGHADCVKLLLEIGASRLSTDAAGLTAAELATQGGHAGIAALISREPLPQELALESPAEVAKSMDTFVDAASATSAQNPTHPPAAPDESAAPGEPAVVGQPAAPAKPQPPPSKPILNEVLSPAVAAVSNPPSGTTTAPANPTAPIASANSGEKSFPLPPLVMRHYRQREIPLQVRSVEGETATLTIDGASRREIKVRAGETVPGSHLIVLRIQKRMQDSKLNLGKPMEVSVVEVRDSTTGTTREWISGVPSTAHDPVALIEDAATGRRYTAVPGQRFKSADGAEFIIGDVRPNQIVIEDAASGATQTIPLRGPRG